MPIIYITEHGSELGIKNGRFEIRKDKILLKSIPCKVVDGITIIGRVQVTSQCAIYCLNNEINILYMSIVGNVFGMTTTYRHINQTRQRKQIELYNDSFRIPLAKKTIPAKIYNQFIVLRRYEKSKGINNSQESKMMLICMKKIKTANSMEKIIGYEGSAAKYYFSGLSKCVDKNYVFKGRSRRPARDEFNMLLNMGYHILLGTVLNCIEHKGLNPYMGFIHCDNKKHPSLASDLIEEWRAVIVDAAVMSLINGHEIRKCHFKYDKYGRVISLSKDGFEIFINKIESKFSVKNKYLSYMNRPVEFREAIWLQVNQLAKAIDYANPELYKAVMIR